MKKQIIIINHLCDSCIYKHKCRRFKEIVVMLRNFESDVFEEWGMDLNVFYSICECNKFKGDFSIDEFEDNDSGDNYEQRR